MRFSTPLLPGRLILRYKRFFADVALDSGGRITAHTPNTGTLLGCADPGSRAWVSRDDKPTRKLAYTWEIAESAGTLVGVHTGRANALAQEAILAGTIAALAGYARLRREVRYGENSRIDLLLEDGLLENGLPGDRLPGDGPPDHGSRPPCYVEVKNVTLARGGVALFPDAVTARGAKHLRELMTMAARGARAAMLFVVQREDCASFAPADDIDPVYGETLRRAAASGVEVFAYAARVSPEELRLERMLPVRL